MIITCPNCGARFRLAVTPSQPARMRCAACDHRWIAEFDAEPVGEIPLADHAPPRQPEPPAPEAPDAAASDAGAPDAGASDAGASDAGAFPAQSPAAEDQPPETAPLEPEPVDAPRSTLLRTIAAVILGGAFAIAAGALWVVRIDPTELPVVGDRLAALAPRPLPLQIEFAARTTELAPGERLLEITGTIRNKGAEAVDLPDLEARLATPTATQRRWRIAPPVARLGPGASAAFTSTATGFPADATIVAIRPAR